MAFSTETPEITASLLAGLAGHVPAQLNLPYCHVLVSSGAAVRGPQALGLATCNSLVKPMPDKPSPVQICFQIKKGLKPERNPALVQCAGSPLYTLPHPSSITLILSLLALCCLLTHCSPSSQGKAELS